MHLKSVLLISLLLIISLNAQCTTTNCTTCTLTTGCGWCASTGQCLAGTTVNTSTDGTCDNTNGGWLFGTSCTDACVSNSNCTMCTSTTGAATGYFGYCYTSPGRCLLGNVTSSADGTCLSGRDVWALTTADCYPACTFQGCSNCAGIGSCGWCLATSVCLPGNGTSSIDGTCASDSWTYSSGGCTTCSDILSCVTCAETKGCGWCNNQTSCKSGSITGSTDGTCKGSQWKYFGIGSKCSAVRDFSLVLVNLFCLILLLGVLH